MGEKKKKNQATVAWMRRHQSEIWLLTTQSFLKKKKFGLVTVNSDSSVNAELCNSASHTRVILAQHSPCLDSSKALTGHSCRTKCCSHLLLYLLLLKTRPQEAPTLKEMEPEAVVVSVLFYIYSTLTLCLRFPPLVPAET